MIEYDDEDPAIRRRFEAELKQECVRTCRRSPLHESARWKPKIYHSDIGSQVRCIERCKIYETGSKKWKG